MRKQKRTKPIKMPKYVDLEVEYERAPYYTYHPADGALIGPTPKGKLRIEFFREHFNQHDKTIVTLDLKNKKSKENVEPGKLSGISRELLTGFMLDPTAAKNIGELLIEKAEQFLNPPEDADLILLPEEESDNG